MPRFGATEKSSAVQAKPIIAIFDFALMSVLADRMSNTERIKLPAGWYVQLAGDAPDLADWARSLNAPFDPIVFSEADGTTFLTTTEFGDLDDASDVRDRALSIIAQLNGAMSVMHGASPVVLNSVVHADATGARRQYMIIEAAGIVLGRATVFATAVVSGPDGQAVPPQPPQASSAQDWLRLSAQNDLVADMLAFLSRANNWYDLYKTIECAEKLVGGEHSLPQYLGDTAKKLKDVRTTANFYRHARAYRPPHPVALTDALPIVRWVVRTVLDLQLSSRRA